MSTITALQAIESNTGKIVGLNADFRTALGTKGVSTVGTETYADLVLLMDSIQTGGGGGGGARIVTGSVIYPPFATAQSIPSAPQWDLFPATTPIAGQNCVVDNGMVYAVEGTNYPIDVFQSELASTVISPGGVALDTWAHLVYRVGNGWSRFIAMSVMTGQFSTIGLKPTITTSSERWSEGTAMSNDLATLTGQTYYNNKIPTQLRSLYQSGPPGPYTYNIQSTTGTVDGVTRARNEIFFMGIVMK